MKPEKEQRDGGNCKDNRDLCLIPISPDVSDYCVCREIERVRREQVGTDVQRERDLGEVSTLQQETRQSAFNHSEPAPPDSEEDRPNFSHHSPLITTYTHNKHEA